MTQTINITPKWMGLFRLFSEWIMYKSSKEQKQAVIDSLKQLCEFADKYNDEQDAWKKTKGTKVYSKDGSLIISRETSEDKPEVTYTNVLVNVMGASDAEVEKILEALNG